jgi:hypothetical protein
MAKTVPQFKVTDPAVAAPRTVIYEVKPERFDN